MRVFFLIAVLLSAGCGSIPDEPVNTSPQIQFKGRPEDLPEAQAAVEEWNRVCGTHIALLNSGIPMEETSSITASGLTTEFHQKILKIQYRPDAPRRWTFVHELGHVLLIPHQDRGIMTASETVNDGVTAEDCGHIGEGL